MSDKTEMILCDYPEAQRRLSLSRSTIKRAVADNLIVPTRIGRATRFSVDELRAFPLVRHYVSEGFGADEARRMAREQLTRSRK